MVGIRPPDEEEEIHQLEKNTAGHKQAKIFLEGMGQSFYLLLGCESDEEKKLSLDVGITNEEVLAGV